jgi:hypothetical protein
MCIKVDPLTATNGRTKNYPYNVDHPPNLMNAGLNVSLLFGSSALCEVKMIQTKSSTCSQMAGEASTVRTRNGEGLLGSINAGNDVVDSMPT